MKPNILTILTEVSIDSKIFDLKFISSVSHAIIERIPHAITMRNQIPKAYLPYDLYCNLIPNSDPNQTSFSQVPRTGSFEVSYKGLVSF
jgi:hypothetical protein